MTYDVNMDAMREYVLGKYRNEGEFDFMKEGMLEKIVELLLRVDAAYMEGLEEEGEYDDDAAYELLFESMRKQFPDYKMYAMRFCEDYLDFAEEFLVNEGAIEWI